MKKDIILAGVGGQGILSIAAVIGTAAINSGMHLKQAEVHGMSQRGGDVHSNLRISEKPIHSDLIPRGGADIIISVEPMEGLRYLPMLSKTGWLITNVKPHINIPNYPAMEDIMAEIEKIPNHIALDADEMAKKVATSKSANIVILGAATPYLGFEEGQLEKAIEGIFGSKGTDVVESNLKALEAGRDYAMSMV
jgi:indolepyruvate ferredoxin oxidoreductase beta subunit